MSPKERLCRAPVRAPHVHWCRPTPNELTPARRFAPAASPRYEFRWNAERTVFQCHMRVGRHEIRHRRRSRRRAPTSAALMRPVTPAAASRWPIFPFTDPSAQWPSAPSPPKAFIRPLKLDGIAERRGSAVALHINRCFRGRCCHWQGLPQSRRPVPKRWVRCSPPCPRRHC